jgi:phosphotransferase system HPr-like phosphotransfer protein
LQKLATMINEFASQMRLRAGQGSAEAVSGTTLTPVGAAEGCDLLILNDGGAEIATDQKIAAFGSSYRDRVGIFKKLSNTRNAKTRFRGFL